MPWSHVTAWVGLIHFIEPKAGQTIVVDAASGAVGSAVGQLARSWYVFGFHVPVLRTRIPALLARLQAEGEPTPTAADQQRGIALYRANVLRRVFRGPDPRCVVPTTVVVPTHDPMLSTNLTDGLDRWIPDLRVVHVEAGHWWPYTHPADAARVLLERVREGE